MKSTKNQTTTRRHRVRTKLKAVSNRPRLHVYRSNHYIYAQVIDISGKVITSASSQQLSTDKSTKLQQASAVGKLIAKQAKAKKITKIAFDRGSYHYHGRVKALAEAAREAGLDF